MGVNTGPGGTNIRYLGAFQRPLHSPGKEASSPLPRDRTPRCSSWQHGRVTAGSCTHQCTHACFVYRRSCFSPPTAPLRLPPPGPPPCKRGS